MCGIPATHSEHPISLQILTKIFMAFFSSYTQPPENYINLVDDAYTFSTSL